MTDHDRLADEQQVCKSLAAGERATRPSKLIASGEGGAIVSADPELRNRVSEASNCGRRRDGRESEILSDNHRMTEFQAAVADAYLTVFDDMRQVRSRSYFAFRDVVKRSASQYIPERPGDEVWSGYRAVAYISSNDSKLIDEVKSKFDQSGLTLHPIYEFVYKSPLIPVDIRNEFSVSDFAGSANRDGLVLIDREYLLEKSFERKINSAIYLN